MNNHENALNPTFRDYPQPIFTNELRNSWVASIVGIILVFLGSSLLLWNEGRAIMTSSALEEGLRDITVPDNIDSVFVENDEKPVLVAGHLSIRNSLRDDTYGVAIQAAKLKKIVSVERDAAYKETKGYKFQWSICDSLGQEIFLQ